MVCPCRLLEPAVLKDWLVRPGRNKLVINHLGRLFVTSDAATIIREIEVVHPAAKLLVLASQAQEAEVSHFIVVDIRGSMLRGIADAYPRRRPSTPSSLAEKG